MTAYFAEIGERFGFEPGDAWQQDADSMAAPDGFFVVATSDGEPVACGGVQRLPDGAAEIKRMWVHPGWRGAGLGARLLRHLEDLARQRGHAGRPPRHQRHPARGHRDVRARGLPRRSSATTTTSGRAAGSRRRSEPLGLSAARVFRCAGHFRSAGRVRRARWWWPGRARRWACPAGDRGPTAGDTRFAASAGGHRPPAGATAVSLAPTRPHGPRPPPVARAPGRWRFPRGRGP